jgi:hypothetical protein
MNSRAFCLTLLSTIAITIAASLPAQAQRARVFVSVNGNDGNPCTAVSPCRTFQAAHDAVLAEGEISVLDTGGYGTLIINKAISIVAIGVQASIAVPSFGTGITINANFGDSVSLRGLILDGQGNGENGIVFNTGLSLEVVDCVVRNMVAAGLTFSAKATTTQQLIVSNSYFAGNHEDGVHIQTTNLGTLAAAIDRTTFYGNQGNGLAVNGAGGSGGLFVAVTDSVAANNGNNNSGVAGGFCVASGLGFGSVSNLSLTHCLVEGNIIGISSFGSRSTLWLAQSTLTANATGFSINGGLISSYGDNYITANGPNIGSLTPVGKQ